MRMRHTNSGMMGAPWPFSVEVAFLVRAERWACLRGRGEMRSQGGMDGGVGGVAHLDRSSNGLAERANHEHPDLEHGHNLDE